MKKPTTWRISGDAGDSVFALALMHALGGKHVIRCVDRPGVTSPWIPRVPLIKELFEAQDYIEKVEISEQEPNIDLVAFRRWHGATTTLVTAMLNEYNVQVEEPLEVDASQPWMSVKPDKTMAGKIIIARSPRYNNSRFPWKQIVEHYGNRLVFVGLPNEHDTFRREYGHVNHLITVTLMDVARAIAGASLFIGNQSSPHAIALALGVDMISEVADFQPDCVYPRLNVQYVCNGACTLPNIADSGEAKMPVVPDIPPNFNTAQVPPGMWQYPGIPPCPHFGLQRGYVETVEKCTSKEAERRLFHVNALRVPDFFNGTVSDPLGLFKQAYANAFPVTVTGSISNTTSPSEVLTV